MIQEKYHRFRQWQQQPFDYQDTDDHHGCCNCGNEYENNYCPRCGQRAVYGPITWRSVWQGILDVWGVGTRSLPYSLWQLIWRPGYLMRDYISGKRQVSFPPVKMLVVVALVLVLVNSLLGVNYDEGETVINNNAYEYYMDLMYNWMEKHIAWTVLMAFSMFIVPVWFLFRRAPRLPRHTLPQGFYVQVFIGVQFLLCLLLLILFSGLIPSLSSNGDGVAGFMVVIVLPVLLMIDYRQLFGYEWWGTLWRILVSVVLMVMSIKLILGLGGIVTFTCVHDWDNLARYVMAWVNYLAWVWVVLEVVNLFSTRPWQDSSPWTRWMWRPLLAFAAVLVITFASERLGYGNSLKNLLETFRGLVISQ